MNCTHPVECIKVYRSPEVGEDFTDYICNACGRVYRLDGELARFSRLGAAQTAQIGLEESDRRNPQPAMQHFIGKSLTGGYVVVVTAPDQEGAILQTKALFAHARLPAVDFEVMIFDPSQRGGLLLQLQPDGSVDEITTMREVQS